MLRYFFLPTLLVAACGGTTNGGDASTDGATEGSAGDGGVGLLGPYACGATTCMTGEYCVHPCCGGAPVPCDPVPDSGMCPQGTEYTPQCMGPFPKGPGCQPPPCKPAPPYCATKDACIGGPTQTKRDAYCLCG